MRKGGFLNDKGAAEKNRGAPNAGMRPKLFHFNFVD